MHSSTFSNLLSTYLLLLLCASRVSANYFIINDPQLSTQWSNNAVNLITWSKGLRDGIHGFDVEMARLSKDGLILVARNVPASQGKLNIFLQDVPAGDDYFLIFINSTHGVMHSTSPRFSVIASGTSPSGTSPKPATGVPTVTVSGGPNPTQQFATTFPAIANGAPLSVPAHHLGQLTVLLSAIVLGAIWTLS